MDVRTLVLASDIGRHIYKPVNVKRCRFGRVPYPRRHRRHHGGLSCCVANPFTWACLSLLLEPKCTEACSCRVRVTLSRPTVTEDSAAVSPWHSSRAALSTWVPTLSASLTGRHKLAATAAVRLVLARRAGPFVLRATCPVTPSQLDYRGGPLWRPRAPQRFSTSFLGPPNSRPQLLQLTVRLGNSCGLKF